MSPLRGSIYFARLAPRATPCRPCRGSIPADQAADFAQDRSFFLSSTACRHDSAGHARERQGLEPDFAGAGDGGEEETLAAEEGVFDSTDELDVIVDARREGDDAAGVDFEH